MNRPNILLIMTDEHAPMYSGPYGHPLVQTPFMDQLAAEGATFANAYCNSPLCLPSRMSVYDWPLHQPYWSLRQCQSPPVGCGHLGPIGYAPLAYDVVLAGKQHFCGPDQLQRLPHSASARFTRRVVDQRRRPARHTRLEQGHTASRQALGWGR